MVSILSIMPESTECVQATRSGLRDAPTPEPAAWGLEGRDGQNRPDRGGQRAEYEALSRSVGSAWLSDLGHIKWFRGARPRAQDAPRPDPDGHPAAAGLRSRSDALDQ